MIRQKRISFFIFLLCGAVSLSANAGLLPSLKPEAKKEQVAKSKESKPSQGEGLAVQAGQSACLTNNSSQAVSNAADLLPHRATYGITLDNNSDDENIADANGEMTIQLAKIGDGWAIEQKSTLHIYYKDGSAEQVITILATYESMDGLKYDFNVRTLRGEEEEFISGEAILASKGGAGIVTYQQPDESTVQLPVGTVFPTRHLIGMIQAAVKKQKVVSNIVFDGSSETHEAVQVDTVLGAAQDPKLVLSNKDLLQFKRVWPMNMAVYALDSKGPDADYEIVQHVLDRGVIRDMTLDYGTFKVKVTLNQVEVFS